MVRAAKVIIMIHMLFLLTGCNDMRILEEQAMAQMITYDLVKKNVDSEVEKIKVSLAIPLAEKQGEQKVIKATAQSSKDARLDLSSQTGWNLVNGQLRTILIGNSLASLGVLKQIDTLERDPSIAGRTKLTIVDGDAAKLLSGKYDKQLATYEYIDRILDKEAKNNTIPEQNLYFFERDIHDDGVDPVAPLITSKKKNIHIAGIALFRDGHYITKIDSKRTVIFSLIRKELDDGQINFRWPSKKDVDQEYIAFNNVKSNKNVYVKHDPGTKDFTVTISVKVKGSVSEYLGNKSLAQDENRGSIEKKMEEYLEHNMDRLVAFTQKNHVDSFGIGKSVRNSISHQEWKSLDWREVYPTIKVKCKAQVLIRDYGVVK